MLQDNRLNVEVARDSRLIALATGRDSMAMKTVALMTMFFLPATFLAVRTNFQQLVRIFLLTADCRHYSTCQSLTGKRQELTK